MTGDDPAVELEHARTTLAEDDDIEVDDFVLLLGLEMSAALPAETASLLVAYLADDERTPRFFAVEAAELRLKHGLPVVVADTCEDYNKGKALLGKLTFD